MIGPSVTDNADAPDAMVWAEGAFDSGGVVSITGALSPIQVPHPRGIVARRKDAKEENGDREAGVAATKGKK